MQGIAICKISGIGYKGRNSEDHAAINCLAFSSHPPDSNNFEERLRIPGMRSVQEDERMDEIDGRQNLIGVTEEEGVMKTMVEINGVAHGYGEGISNLEGMLAFMRTRCIPREQVVVEVRVDGEVFSEAYRNQAREVPLADVGKIEIATQTGKAFAWGFMAEAPQYIAHLQRGFEAAIRLLRDPEEEGEGYQMLAKSLETLLAFKSHFDNVLTALEENGRCQALREFWTAFKDTAESILEVQEQMDSSLLAGQLEKELMPRLEQWKQTVARVSAQ